MVLQLGRQVGIVSDSRWAGFESTRSEITRVTEMLRKFALSPQVRSTFDPTEYVLTSR